MLNFLIRTKFLGPDLSQVKNIQYANFQTGEMKMNSRPIVHEGLSGKRWILNTKQDILPTASFSLRSE